MKRLIGKPAVTSRIKDHLNRALNTAGLQLGTTKAERIERSRLERLVARGHWNALAFSDGLVFDPERCLAFLKSVCEPYRSQLENLPVVANENERFFRNNGWFESVDADVLYGVVRHFAPAQVVEIGSGYSTRLTARAIRDGRLDTRLICIDPSPRVEIEQCADEFIRRPVEELPVSELSERLKPGDVLFIDSSHLIITGGDVVYIYLQVLPQLRPGVLIHAHDIFLPFEYPQEFVVGEQWGWGEQYLVHALLMGNPNFEVMWASCYMWQMRRKDVFAVLPVQKTFPPPSSLWLRKR